MTPRKYLCVEKIKQGNKIIAYKIIDGNSSIMQVNADNLKQSIKEKEIEVINLKLTSDNRLVSIKLDKRDCENKSNTTLLKTVEQLNKLYNTNFKIIQGNEESKALILVSGALLLELTKDSLRACPNQYMSFLEEYEVSRLLEVGKTTKEIEELMWNFIPTETVIDKTPDKVGLYKDGRFNQEFIDGLLLVIKANTRKANLHDIIHLISRAIRNCTKHYNDLVYKLDINKGILKFSIINMRLNKTILKIESDKTFRGKYNFIISDIKGNVSNLLIDWEKELDTETFKEVSIKINDCIRKTIK